MPQDVIQIGFLTIPKILIDILFPLIGTIIGGFISYFSIRAVENLRWAQQNANKYQEERREAIAKTLDWLDPYRDAITKAQSLTGDLLMRRVDEEQYILQWPKILFNPAINDPPKRMRILLPEDIYPRFFAIMNDLETVRTIPLQAVKGTPEFGIRYKQTQEHLSTLEKQLNELENDLISIYKNTYKPSLRKGVSSN